jgi:hypothetical protein
MRLEVLKYSWLILKPGQGSPSLPGNSFGLEKLGHATRHATKLEIVGFLAKKVMIPAA